MKNAISYELEKQLMSAVFEKFLKEDHKTNLSPYTKKEAVANIWSEYKKYFKYLIISHIFFI